MLSCAAGGPDRPRHGAAVGAVELRPTRAHEADVSYVIAPEFRGQGLAPKALDALLAWASSDLGLRWANLGCHVDNAASRRVAEKCGFAFVEHRGDELRFRRALGGAKDTVDAR
jgi:RimJ/RimL family protein N-acetyltransferase